MSLVKIPFDGQKIKISQIFCSEEVKEYTQNPVPSQKIKSVYGSDLRFPEAPLDRPYIFSSFVTSIDGKLAYADKPSAFYVAGKNEMAGAGKETDFWILNALRGICDAAIIGGNSMKTDADYSMHVMDEDIEADRIAAGLEKVPLNIVMSLDATDIPMDHDLLKSQEVPSMVATSIDGLAYIKDHFKGEYIVVDENMGQKEIKDKLALAGTGILPVLVTGKGSMPDTKKIMEILRSIGIERLLIESPGYGHYLVKQKMMDEFFLNMSAVYIGGGDTMTLGKADKGFLAESHPHMKILSIHMFNEYFVYFRYKFNYDFM